MSLWTPSGEHPIDPSRGTQGTDEAVGHAHAPGEGPRGARDPGAPPEPGGAGAGEAHDPEVDELRQQLLDSPAHVVVANHCYGLFELAAVYLSASPPRLDQARLAIDALGALIDGVGERLGEPHEPLRDALAQIRLAFVQISATPEAAGDGAPDGAEGTSGDGDASTS